jgi:hypothetical protein
MPRRKSSIGPVSEIRIDDAEPSLRAVYVVEVLNRSQSETLSRYIEELSPDVSAVQLSDGKLMSYALTLQPGSEQLLVEIEETLKARFGFVMSGTSGHLVYDTLAGLCTEFQSTLLPHHPMFLARLLGVNETEQ